MSTTVTTNQLTSEQLDDLMARYYAGENVAELIRDFRLVIAPNAISRLFPNRILVDLPCPYCATPMEQRLPSRSALQNCYGVAAPICPSCGHQDGVVCHCSGCGMRRRDQVVGALEQRRARTCKRGGQEAPKTAGLGSPTSLQDMIDIVALCRAGRHEDTDNIAPLWDHALPVCCTVDRAVNIVWRLYEHGHINVGAEATDGDWMLAEEGARLDIDMGSIPWELALGNGPADNLDILSSLERRLRRPSEWPPGWEAELGDLWRDCALDEVLAYFAARLHQHGFEPRIGDKTKQVFSALLDHFSVYQAYNFVWAAVKNAAAYKLRTRVSGRHAANTVVGYCQQRAERAIAEGWSIKPYRRDPAIPVSVRNSLYANVVTGLGERFFSDAPGQATSVLSTKRWFGI